MWFSAPWLICTTDCDGTNAKVQKEKQCHDETLRSSLAFSFLALTWLGREEPGGRVTLGSSERAEPVTPHASWQDIDGEGGIVERLEQVKERLGLGPIL